MYAVSIALRSLGKMLRGLELAFAGAALNVGFANPVPSAGQQGFTEVGITMFMHFGPCTFLNCQWDTQVAPPDTFQPTNLDTDQWMQAAILLGADEVCLTVRHVDGFSLWPTAANNYSVMASSWRNGTGDVAADFVASAKKFNIKTCFYIILGFNFWANYSGVSDAEYLSQQVTALTELLTNYGPVGRLWWDNYALDGRVYQPVTHAGFVCPGDRASPSCPHWATLTQLVRTLSPSTMVVPGPDGCLVDAENAGGTYPLYHAAVPLYDGNAGSYWCNTADGPSNGTAFVAVESDYSIENPGDNWYWGPDYPFMDAGDIWSTVTLKHGQGANLIFNVPPDNTGNVPVSFMSSLAQYREVWDGTYSNPVAFLPSPVSGPCPGLSFTVPVSSAAVFDQLYSVEDMGVAGQVVNGYTVEAWSEGGGWKDLPVHGVTVGARIRDWGLGDVTNVTALRWNCSSAIPGTLNTNATIKSFAAYLGAPIPGRGDSQPL